MITIIIFSTLTTCLARNLITIEQSIFDTNFSIKLVQEEQMIIQYFNNATFLFESLQNNAEQSIAVELFFEYPDNSQVDVDFQIIQKRQKVIVNIYKDLDGYFLQKSHRFIVISADNHLEGDQFFITIFIKQILEKPYQYLLKISQSKYQICRNQCNMEKNFGTCEPFNQCNCVKDRIDLDCSLSAIELEKNNELSISICGIQYLFFQPDAQIDQASFKINTQEQVIVYMMFENQSIGVPSQNHNDYKFNISELGQHTLNLSQLKYNNSYLRYERLLISLEASHPVTLTVSLNLIQLQNDGNYYARIFLFAFGLLTAIGLTIWVCYYEKYQKLPKIDLNGPGYNKFWTLVNDFMPKIEYSLKDDAQDQYCQVCLNEFEDKQICRITPCKHVFHSACLEKWLKVIQSCPKCETILNEESLDTLHEDYSYRLKVQKILKIRKAKKNSKIDCQKSGDLIIEDL